MRHERFATKITWSMTSIGRISMRCIIACEMILKASNRHCNSFRVLGTLSELLI